MDNLLNSNKNKDLYLLNNQNLNKEKMLLLFGTEIVMITMEVDVSASQMSIKNNIYILNFNPTMQAVPSQFSTNPT
jgi:hypothetical protein